MSAEAENRTTEVSELARTGQVLAERWADFTKALAIYPEANSRVRKSLDDFFDALRTAHATPGAGAADGLSVIFNSQGMLICEEPTEIRQGTNVSWLSERIRKAALAGVVLRSDLEGDALVRFTKRLLVLWTQRTIAESFENLWPETFTGLELIDRRFEGTFADESGDAPQHQRSWGEGGGALGAGGLESGDKNLVTQLLKHDEIAARLKHLEEHIAQKGDETEIQRFRTTDLIGRIVQHFPADAVTTFDTALELTLKTLDAVDERADWTMPMSRSDATSSDNTLGALMASLSQRLFGRSRPPAMVYEALAADTPRAQGHAGDEAFQDDLEAFFEEFHQLPEPGNTPLSLQECDVASEQLGVYLHEMVHVATDDKARALYGRITQALDGADEESLDVLRQYLEFAWQATDDEAVRTARVRLAGYLREAGLMHLLRASGFLSVDNMAQTFPEGFGLYVETLNPQDAGDTAELHRLATAVGAQRIRDAADHLLEHEGLLDRERVRKLFQRPADSLIPFAELILERGGASYREDLLQSIYQRQSQFREVALFQIVEHQSFIPRDYLLKLLAAPTNPIAARSLRHQASVLACRCIRVFDQDPDRMVRKVRAIEFLRDFRTSEAELLLQELVKAWRIPFILRREPRAVRVAAKAVLRQYRHLS